MEGTLASSTQASPLPEPDSLCLVPQGNVRVPVCIAELAGARDRARGVTLPTHPGPRVHLPGPSCLRDSSVCTVL